ncbi:MAG TPA: autotransporter-associated beta strand repeat-containing protein [Terrimicrobiaceae bacterium]|nr:autotransporter-associated beta strand repeat-containing protein [Terrimicrobiaceae bacterium]
MNTSIPPVRAALLILLASSASGAFGQSIRTWTGTSLSDSNWTTSANWNTLPVAGDSLTFSGSNRTSNTNTFAADTTFANLTFNAGTAFTLGGNRILLSGTISGATSVSAINLDMLLSGTRNVVTNTSGGTLTINGVIGESGGSRGLAKLGTGELVLNGTNTYTGSTSLSGGGRLVLGNAQALGTGGGGLIIGATAGNTLVNASGTSLSLSHAVTLADATNISFEGSHNITFTGDVTRSNSNTRQIAVAAGLTTTFAGNFTSPGSLGGISKNGAGNLALSGSNQLNNLTVTAGVLTADSANAFGTGNIVTFSTGSNAVLGLGNIGGAFTRAISTEIRFGDGTGIASFVNGGTSAFNSSTGTITYGMTNFVSTNLQLGHSQANGTIDFQNALSLTNTAGVDRTVTAVRGANSAVKTDAIISGVVSGSGNFVKAGDGVLALSNVNTYTGTTSVTAGTLIISGGISNSSPVNVSGGARLAYNSATARTGAIVLNGSGTSSRAALGGTGAINTALTLDNIGDTLSPGNSPGIQQFGVAQSWQSFTYEWEVNNFSGLTAGTNFDQIGITGSLALTGSGPGSYLLDILCLTAGNEPGILPNFSETSRSWIVLTTTGGISGFNSAYWNLNTADFETAVPFTGTFSLGVSGNDLVLTYTAVPEPATAGLMALGALAFLANRRRKKPSVQS